jgi:hypothetical protein
VDTHNNLFILRIIYNRITNFVDKNSSLKRVVTKLVKTFLAFYCILSFIAMFAGAGKLDHILSSACNKYRILYSLYSSKVCSKREGRKIYFLDRTIIHCRQKKSCYLSRKEMSNRLHKVLLKLN